MTKRRPRRCAAWSNESQRQALAAQVGVEHARGALGEGAPDLVAAGRLGARDLGVSAAAGGALVQQRAEAAADPLTGRQLGVALAEAAPAVAAAVAALAPEQIGAPAGERQVAHTHAGPLLRLHARLPAVRAAGCRQLRLDAQLELLAALVHGRHDQLLQAEDASNLRRHPLSLLARRSMTTQSLERAADDSCYALIPARSARAHIRHTSATPP